MGFVSIKTIDRSSKMSSSAFPITPARFAEAILELPLPTLHLKAAEIRNSISHLTSSNAQLQTFADDGDKDCEEAIEENKGTMLRMEERVGMLRHEVERRGFRLSDDTATESHDGQDRSNGHVGSRENLRDSVEGVPNANATDFAMQRRGVSTGGSLEDTDSARGIGERVESDQEEGDDGVHI